MVGGYALGIHGYPRYTGDLDIWVEISSGNAKKLIEVFEDFGLASFGLVADDFLKEENIIQIGYPPFRIDVITTIDGVRFEKAYPNKKEVDIDGLEVLFIGLEDLKRNKRASGRLRDLDDLRWLEKYSAQSGEEHEVRGEIDRMNKMCLYNAIPLPKPHTKTA